MDGTNIAPRGCKFISGDPCDIHTDGLAIFCGQPAARKGGSWCQQHEAVVFVTPKKIREAREVA